MEIYTIMICYVMLVILAFIIVSVFILLKTVNESLPNAFIILLGAVMLSSAVPFYSFASNKIIENREDNLNIISIKLEKLDELSGADKKLYAIELGKEINYLKKDVKYSPIKEYKSEILNLNIK